MQKLLFFTIFLTRVSFSIGQLAVPVAAPDTNRVTPLLNKADAIIYSDPAAAMRYTNEALEISEKKLWPKGVALSLREKGNVYYVLGDNTGAMDCYIKALKTARPLNIRKLDASLFNNLANIYSDLKQYEKALEYYHEFLSAARELKAGKEETIALVNMATVYTELNDLEKALDCNRQALDIARRDQNTNFIPIIWNNMGITYNKKGDTAQALSCFRQSIDLSDKYDNKNAKASSLNEAGKIYFAQGDYVHAKKYALQSLQIARELSSAEWQSNAWQTLYAVYEKQRQPDSALGAYKNYILYRDSVLNDEKKSALTRKEMQFDFERKEASLRAENDKKAALAQAEIGRQALIKRGILAGAIVLLLAAIACFILYKKRRDAEETKAEMDFKAKVSETEMKVLRLQMNPHFIFNALNSVSDYISKHETTTANYFLVKFAKMMRMVLENSEKSEITLARELEVLELYMQLESLRLKNNFTYEILIEKGIDKEATLIPPMILQPFVENSIWHGIHGKPCAGRILVRISQENGMINCVVEDNGIGRKKAANAVSHGKQSMGLKITGDRIDIINKMKRTKASVDIFDLMEGTRVELKLPLELNY